jgi:hypothetical protein
MAVFRFVCNVVSINCTIDRVVDFVPVDDESK